MPAVLGVLDEVPHDQEVAAVAHALDHAELEVGPLHRLGGDRIAVAVAQPVHDELAQVRRLALAVGRGIAGDQLAIELDLDVAALGDLQRGGDRLGPSANEVAISSVERK